MVKKDYYKDGKLEKSVKTFYKSGTEIVETNTFDNRTDREKRRDRRKELKLSTSEDVAQVSGIFRIISLLLIIAFLSRFLFPTDNGSLPSLQGLLSYLSNAPVIPNSFFQGLSSLKIIGDWGIVDGLRVFINTISSILSFALWIVLGLVNVTSFLLYIVAWIFGV